MKWSIDRPLHINTILYNLQKNGIVKPQLPAKLREATLNLINTQQNHRKPEEGLGGRGTN